MKHQGKQALAWVIAVSAASTVYGGTSFWLKRLAAQQSAGHDSGEHEGSEEHVAAHDDGGKHKDPHGVSDDHGDTSGHQEKTPEHGSDHGDHKTASHAPEDATTADKHHPAKGHEESHAEHAAPRGQETAAKGHDDHGKTAPHAEAKTEHAAAEHGKKDDHTAHVASAEHGKASENTKDAKPHQANAAPHWSYEKKDATGPSHWGQLNEQFSQCEKGREQSPIDLRGAVSKANAPHITWHYNQVAVNVENNGHTIVSNMPNEQNHIKIDDETYTLAQFHFHNPSEHKISGIPSDLELHFVHKNAKGQLAVIGVMINEKAGDENPFFKPLWSTLPREAHGKSETKPSLNLAKMLPTHRDYFHYAGSLTTPPCSQGVRWFVLKEPVTMNGSQVELYSSIFGGSTNRPVQPVFGREIIQSSGQATVAH